MRDVYEPKFKQGLPTAAPETIACRPYRQLMEHQVVDAVLFMTPEDWHHRLTPDTMDASKDVYVEKPLGHTPEQHNELTEAQRKSERIVQVAMQRRL